MPETITPFGEPRTVAGQYSRRGGRPAPVDCSESIAISTTQLGQTAGFLEQVGDYLLSSPYGSEVPDLELPITMADIQAAKDNLQRHIRPIVAGTLVTATLANSAPVLSTANAEPAGRVGGNTAAHSETARQTAQKPQDQIVPLPRGGAIYKIAVPIAKQRGVNPNTETREIEQASGVYSEAQAENLHPGFRVHIPVAGAPEYIREPLGSNLSTTAAENGLTLTQLLNLNPKYWSHPDVVQAGALLKISGNVPSHETATIPAPKPVVSRKTVKKDTAHKHPAEVSAKPAPLRSKQHAIKPHHEAPQSRKQKQTLPGPQTYAARQKAATPKTLSKPTKSAAQPVIKPVQHTARISPPGSGLALGALRHDVSRAFQATAGASQETSHHLKHQIADSLSSTAQEVLGAIPHLGGHNKPHRLISRLGDCASTGHMFGKTPQQIAMNYFIICQGDTVEQAGGVVGNLTQESSLQAQEIENGGFSKNPADAGKGGWGIAQWTPGSKALSESKKYGIKGPVYTLQSQLALVSAEMKGQSPTGQHNMLQNLKRIKDPNQAAENFEQNFEEGPIAAQGGGQLSNRQQYARAAVHTYGKGTLRSLYHWGAPQPPVNHTPRPKDHKATSGPGLFHALGHAWGEADSTVTSGLHNPIERVGHDTRVAAAAISGHKPYLHPTSKGHTGNTRSNSKPHYSHSQVVWPFPTKSTSQYYRIDQGWDIKSTAAAPVRAIASGTMYKFNPNPGGFGNDYPTEKLDKSIGGPTKWVYYGHIHGFKKLFGKHVRAGQEIARTNTHDPQNGSAAPAGWLEIGFAQPDSDVPIQRATISKNSAATRAGSTMHNILRHAPVSQPNKPGIPKPTHKKQTLRQQAGW